MWYGIGIIGFIIFVIIAIWPAKIAASKGRSFLLWFLLSIPFWWITFFVALSLKDNTHTSAPAGEA